MHPERAEILFAVVALESGQQPPPYPMA